MTPIPPQRRESITPPPRHESVKFREFLSKSTPGQHEKEAVRYWGFKNLPMPDIDVCVCLVLDE